MKKPELIDTGWLGPGSEMDRARLPADDAELDLALAGEAVFEGVFRACHVTPACEIHSFEPPSSDST